MELKDHEEQMDSFEVKFAPKRSVLLLVLCILTWVHCTYVFAATILKHLFYYSVFLGKISKLGNEDPYWVLHGVIVPVLCAIGAFFMFQSKRFGFWLYAAGQAVTVGFSMYFIVSATRTFGPGMFFGFLANLFPIAFTIVYATQIFKRKQQPIDLNF